jgi:hypothetical protein
VARKIAHIVITALLVGGLLTGCAGGRRNYERTGMIGAAVASGGMLTQVSARLWVQPRNEPVGITMQTVGTTAMLAGLIMALYALDGAISNGSPSPLDSRNRGPFVSSGCNAMSPWRCPGVDVRPGQ